MDEVCSPTQRVLMDIYRETQPSNHPGGHYLERRSEGGIYISAFIRMSDSLRSPVLYFYDIFSERRGKGLASGTLKRLTESADRHGVVIELPVMANDVPGMSNGLNDDQLIQWYGRFSFELLNERSRGGHPLMRRSPR